MALDFKITDFLQPIEIIRKRIEFQKNQWRSSDELYSLQFEKIKKILKHAYENVPYYKSLFDGLDFYPGEFKSLEDLKRLPVLTKQDLRRFYVKLISDNVKKFRPQKLYTSGTTGERIEFLVDGKANAIEFCYYWRHWGWAGYRIGHRFAQFSPSFFIDRKHKGLYVWQSFLNRLLLNTLSIDKQIVFKISDQLFKFNISFLKGHPSALYYFARIAQDENISIPPLKGIFTAGEILYPHQREVIQRAFACRIYDHYGQMERVIAATECEFGGMHINSDYGLWEFENICEIEKNRFEAKIIGTNLYKMGMPLIRYDTGDRVEYVMGAKCQCGRSFQVIKRILGREGDVILTPEGKIAPIVYTVFSRFNEIELGQIVQVKKNQLLIRLVKGKKYDEKTEEKLNFYIRSYVGEDMKIEFQYESFESLMSSARGKKFRIIQNKLVNDGKPIQN